MTAAPPSADPDPVDRDRILTMLEQSMEDLHERIQTANPKSPEEEEIHLKRVRTIGYLANQLRKLQKDRDLDEMQEELALLKEGGSDE